MSSAHTTRIVILGGGFGGIYTALELEKTIALHPEAGRVYEPWAIAPLCRI